MSADISEREIQHAIRLAMGRHPSLRLFRNQVGECDYTDDYGKRRHVSYGLCKGSSDLIGFRTIEVPGLVAPIAQFVAIELKAERGTLRPDQRMFIEAVRARGALAGVARSVEDVIALLDPTLPLL